MKQLAPDVSEEHFYFFPVHDLGDNALSKGRMAYPVSGPEARIILLSIRHDLGVLNRPSDAAPGRPRSVGLMLDNLFRLGPDEG